MDSPVFKGAAEGEWTPTEPGVKRRILTHNAAMMIVEVVFEKGAVGSLHSHPHVQASYVADGVFDVTVSGKTQRLEKGGSFLAPSNEIHGVVAIEAGRLIDAFTPARAEFLG
ncbi:MAG: cupin domain-containing protein [Rhizobiaceae bacterium]